MLPSAPGSGCGAGPSGTRAGSCKLQSITTGNSMQIPGGRWQLECSAEQFAALRSDKEFVFLVTLGRMVNAIKFGIMAKYGAGRRPSLARDRQAMGSFLVLAGLLHELAEFRDKQEGVWG